jgi:DNA replication protein DnaC
VAVSHHDATHIKREPNTTSLDATGWAEVFGDQVVAAAMIDRIVHHADVLTVKGASYRLRGRGIHKHPRFEVGGDV